MDDGINPPDSAPASRVWPLHAVGCAAAAAGPQAGALGGGGAEGGGGGWGLPVFEPIPPRWTLHEALEAKAEQLTETRSRAARRTATFQVVR